MEEKTEWFDKSKYYYTNNCFLAKKFIFHGCNIVNLEPCKDEKHPTLFFFEYTDDLKDFEPKAREEIKIAVQRKREAKADKE